MSRSKKISYVGIVVMLLVVMGLKKGVLVLGQQVPDCAAKLVPCGMYMNSTSPPDTCCNPMREAVRNQLNCLCHLYSDTELFKTLGINMTQALQLPKHCGITSDLTACNNLAPDTTPNVGNSPPSPPSGGSGGTNGASRVAWIGMSGWMGLLLSWVSLVA